MPTPSELRQKLLYGKDARAKREANAPAASTPARNRGDGIDRAALWTKAMKRAAELPPIRD
ncbi:hypothetical protein [Agrobacterium larrymoorei]|uniref:hypothetical protein n=1 Tax=Agrobacterium larrymoorei TaxID=160699 RepID=UPI0030C2E569